MHELLRSRTAFRVFGNFQWPPLPDDPRPDLVEGVIEIHYVELGDGLQAVLRWLPRTHLNNQVSTEFRISSADLQPGGTPHVFDLTPSQLSKLFSNGAPVLLRLDANSKTKAAGGPVLLFRGATVFDQFPLDASQNFTPTSDPVPSPRWILSRSYQQGTVDCFSELLIGRTSDQPATTGSTILFNLALPTPVSHGVVNKKRVYALPISVTFSTRVALHEGLIPLSFMAGSTAAGAQADAEISQQTIKKELSRPHLGSFGFCRSGGGQDFLRFPRKSSASKHWMSDRAVLRAELLGWLGDVSGLSVEHFDFAHDSEDAGGDPGEYLNSVSFHTSVGRETRIAFRYGIVGKIPTFAKDEGALWVKPFTGEFVVRNHLDQLIDTGSRRLILELELRYALDSTNVWQVDKEADGSTLTFRLGFDTTVECGETGDLDSEPDKTSGPATVESLFQDSVNGMRLARVDLRHLESSRPESIFSDVACDTDPVRFALTGRVTIRFDEQGLVEPPQVTDSLRSPLRLTLWPKDRVLHRGGKPEAEATIAATIAPPSFAQLSSQQVSTFSITLAEDPAATSDLIAESCLFKLIPAEGAPDTLWARLGGMQFASTDNTNPIFDDEPDSADYSHWRFGPRAAISDGVDDDRVYRTTTTDLRLRFGLKSVQPIGVDVPRADRSNRRAPLLVNADDSGNGSYLLDLRETVSATADRRLMARLIDRGAAQGVHHSEYVVISEEPFSVTRFRSTALGNRGDQGNTLVAGYDSDTRTWQIKRIASTYHYEFPPQVTGESMDKPRRLAIVDHPRPAVGVAVPVDSYGKNETPRWRAVEFRLAPSAEIWIEPGDVERGYALPEWSSHEILRQHGKYGVGAGLKAFRGEFLYGLSVGVDVNREVGVARGARVAEIEALVGLPPGAPSASNPDLALVKRWQQVSGAIARRPERLEIWNRDVNNASAFPPARFAAGVSFALRNTAVHRAATAEAAEHQTGKYEDGPRIREHGLSGGALWPVESANLFDRLVSTPASNGGHIERIALSPQGGDADQKAEFLRGQVAIISETRCGYVQRHQVEVIGRIGCFWHRAKHVVVYERTVNPTAQFAPEEGAPGTPGPTRRPVLRKVSEFIELLQPCRHFPDFPVTAKSTTGFLNAVRFNSTIINVDSAWSEDVETYGWKIPLWNREAARKRPQVYPRPDVGFVTSAEGEGEDPVVTQECCDPDNLVFFADFETGGNDTDKWQARIGIDSTAWPPPAHQWQPALGADASDGTSRQASAPRVPRGHRRFTWRLAPATQKTRLNASRSDEPIFAGLESVTFMRARPDANNSTTLDKFKRTIDEAAKLRPPVTRLPLWLPGSAPKPLEKVAVALTAFLQATRQGTDDQVKQAALDLSKALPEIETALSTGDLAPYATLAQENGKTLASLDAVIGASDVTSRCTKLVDNLLGSLDRKKLLVLDALASYENDAYLLIDGANDVDALKKAVIDAATKAITPAFEGVGVDRLGLGNSLEAARAIIRDFESDVQALRDAYSHKLAEIRGIYDDGKPWSEARLASLLAKVDGERDGLMLDIESAVVDAHQRLATELDELSRRVGAVSGEALTALQAVASTALARTTACAASIGRVVGCIDALFVPDRFGAADAALTALQSNTQEPYKTQLASAKTLLLAVKAQAQVARDRLRQIETGVDDNLDKLATELAAAESIVAGAPHEFDRLAARIEDIARGAVNDDVRLAEGIRQFLDGVGREIRDGVDVIRSVGTIVDEAVDGFDVYVRNALNTTVFDRLETAIGVASDAGAALAAKIETLEAQFNRDALVGIVSTHVIRPAVDQCFAQLKGPYDAAQHFQLKQAIGRLADEAEVKFRSLTEKEIEEARRQLLEACDALGGGMSNVAQHLQDLGATLQKAAKDQLDKLNLYSLNPAKLRELAQAFDRDIRMIGNDLSAAHAAATGYVDRIVEAVGNLNVNAGLPPGKLLNLYAAVASAPDLPNLSFARDRLGYYFDALNEIVDTTPVEAWFGRLGDELKALGLSLPIKGLAGSLVPDLGTAPDISRVFKNFGGMQLSNLFKGAKLPASAADAIRVRHSFDKHAARAWVQIDIDVPMAERNPLFNEGPFSLDFVNSRMVGFVRLEAAKDSDTVDQTGYASLTTDIEAVVSGETMVSLQKVTIGFDRASGLTVEFDPRNIRLNAVFQFVQDTFGSLFPDEIGGLKVIKQAGIPVGVEHEFSIPPIDLMFGTSGVTNIQVSNRFALVAYPDFVIANRFSLSRPEQPFLFSIFVLGGTGYITIDTEYRPFDRELMVMVEAAAGGSAAIGFGFGPISGSVFITLSVALTYRRIGDAGGGLTVSLVLVVAGSVNVAGVATVYMGLMLRMSYRETGRIDAMGTLTVSIPISRLFTLRARANANYTLRDGRGQGAVAGNVGAAGSVPNPQNSTARANALLAGRG